MSEPAQTQSEVMAIDSDFRRWLSERLVEYRELLAYLRDH